MIRIRTFLGAGQHALAVLGAIVALGLAVTLAHGALGMDHMAPMSGMDDSQAGHSALTTMCLAIVELGGLGATLWVLGLLSRRPRPRFRERPGFVSHSRLLQPPAGRARAAPAAMLQVFRL